MVSPHIEQVAGNERTEHQARLDVTVARLRLKIGQRRALGYRDAPVNLDDLEIVLSAVGPAKSPGQVAYEADLAHTPTYIDGRPRPQWSDLCPSARKSWELHPTFRSRAKPMACGGGATINPIRASGPWPAGKPGVNSPPAPEASGPAGRGLSLEGAAA